MTHWVWHMDPALFRLGSLEIRWYGLFFALGFFLGFQLMVRIYQREGRDPRSLSDLLIYLMLGTIIGARLGHVLFYQPDYYLARPWEILMLWRGGLASHGGFAGVMIALYLFLKKYPDMRFIELADRLTLCCLPAAALIRIGNFFNSEILGTPSSLPWAVVFARVDDIPRHPAMLYEAAAYLIVFAALDWAYWKTAIIQFPGRLFGAALAVCFLARFMIEFVKENQVLFERSLPLNMGQLLSLPFVFTGVYLLYSSGKMPRNRAARSPKFSRE